LESASETEILNYALHLAQEWGENWMKPINYRMMELFPDMSSEMILKYSTISDTAMNDGYSLVSSLIATHGEKIGKQEFYKQFLSKYDWVDMDNISHLYSTGTYYHYK